MTATTDITSNHQEINLLLPWWVNGTLDAEEQQQVAEHVSTCSACQNEVRNLKSLSAAIASSAQESYNKRADVSSDLNRVLERIDHDTVMNTRLDTESSLWNRLIASVASVVSPGPVRQWGAMAMAGLLVLVVGSQILLDQGTDDFSVLSSGDVSETGVMLSVEFGQFTSPAAATRFLSEYAGIPERKPQITRLDDRTYTVGYVGSVDVDVLMQTVNRLQEHADVEQVEVAH